MDDIIFCTLPPIELNSIYSAPALLKGIVQTQGFKARTHDFSMDLFNLCDRNIETVLEIQSIFSIERKSLSNENTKLLNQWYDNVVSTLIDSNCRYYGFSVFSWYTHAVTVEILKRLKERGLTDRVVLGGRGLKTAVSRIAVNNFTEKLSANDRIQWFGETLKKHQLATHVIQGDGEIAIVDFLNNNKDDNIVHIIKGFDFPYPDYSDYNFDDYLWDNDVHTLQVIGSKGCVRDCDFCDVKVQFGNYQFKDGLQLAEEIIYLQRHHNINKFMLVDSLSNGSMKHLMQFITRLSQHNATAPVPVTWNGQYICKEYTPGEQTDTYYQLLKASGAEGLTIGAESGSNNVLTAINKKTTVGALYAELENFRKHNITCQLLTFSGHWSETLDDFDQHCQMMVNLVPYVKSGTISGIQLGVTFAMYSDTPVWHNDTIIRDPVHFENLWISTDNLGNTFKSRVIRRGILELLSNALNLPSTGNGHALMSFIQYINNNADIINKFFIEHGTDQGNIADVDQYVTRLLTAPEDLDIIIQLTSNSTDTDPFFSIKINDTELFGSHLPEGVHELKFTVPYHQLLKENTLSMSMTNKLPNDTVIHNGEIVKDKNIRINELIINNSYLKKDVVFYYNNFYHIKNGDRESTVTDGLWFNGQSLNLKFGQHFTPWYATANSSSTSKWLAREQIVTYNQDLAKYFMELKLAVDKLVI